MHIIRTTISIELRSSTVSSHSITHKIGNTLAMASCRVCLRASATTSNLVRTWAAAIAMDHRRTSHHTSLAWTATALPTAGTQVPLMLLEEVETTWRNTRTRIVGTKWDCPRSLTTRIKTMSTCWGRCAPMVSKASFHLSSPASRSAVKTIVHWPTSSCSKPR